MGSQSIAPLVGAPRGIGNLGGPAFEPAFEHRGNGGMGNLAFEDDPGPKDTGGPPGMGLSGQAGRALALDCAASILGSTEARIS